MSKLLLSRFAGMNIHYRHFPFDYFLNSMVNLGISNIELWAASPHFYINDLTPTLIRKFKKQIKDRNLNLVCLTPEQCVYPINIAAREDYLRKRSIDYFYKNIELASELNSPIMLVTPGCGYFSESNKEAWVLSRDSLKKLTIKAEKLGVILALEPISPYNSNIINEFYSLKKMLTEINSPFLKGIMDLGQMAILHEKIEDYLMGLGDDLIHIHFIDSNKYGAHLALGDGILPLKSYIEKLSNSKYCKCLTLEIDDRKYYLDPEKAMKKSIDKLKELL